VKRAELSVIEQTRATGLVAWSSMVRSAGRPNGTLEQSEELFRQLAANIPEALWVRDVAGLTIRYVNPAWEKVTGRSIAAGDGVTRIFEAIHPDDLQEALRQAAEQPNGGVDHECRVLRPDGTVRWVHARTFAIADTAGAIYRVAGIMQDVTDRKAANERLLELAHYDALTGLPNRTLLYAALRRALDQARAHRWTVSVLFIDIDHFKNVNDTRGHAVGDALLREVASRLVSCLRIRDTVGRLGGDEFALGLVTAGTLQAVEKVAKKVTDALRQPFLIDGAPVTITASIGIAVDGPEALDPESLIQHADAAMYLVKAAGRDDYRFYEAPVAGLLARREPVGARRPSPRP
jgi:diguanylate cyclase (GGDEF)-like protein/PAS domain S-box-containing protein